MLTSIYFPCTLRSFKSIHPSISLLKFLWLKDQNIFIFNFTSGVYMIYQIYFKNLEVNVFVYENSRNFDIKIINLLISLNILPNFFSVVEYWNKSYVHSKMLLFSGLRKALQASDLDIKYETCLISYVEGRKRSKGSNIIYWFFYQLLLVKVSGFTLGRYNFSEIFKQRMN